MEKKLGKNKIFIGDVVNHPNFEAYERFLQEIIDRKTNALFFKPEEEKLTVKIAYIKALKDLQNLNEEAKK